MSYIFEPPHNPLTPSANSPQAALHRTIWPFSRSPVPV